MTNLLHAFAVILFVHCIFWTSYTMSERFRNAVESFRDNPATAPIYWILWMALGWFAGDIAKLVF